MENLSNVTHYLYSTDNETNETPLVYRYKIHHTDNEARPSGPLLCSEKEAHYVSITRPGNVPITRPFYIKLKKTSNFIKLGPFKNSLRKNLHIVIHNISSLRIFRINVVSCHEITLKHEPNLISGAANRTDSVETQPGSHSRVVQLSHVLRSRRHRQSDSNQPHEWSKLDGKPRIPFPVAIDGKVANILAGRHHATPSSPPHTPVSGCPVSD